MAVRARAAHRVIWYVRFILNSMLVEIGNRICLFGSQAVVGAEILHDRARLRRSQLHSVQTHHSLESFLPAFRSGPFPGDASEIALFVLGVASSALADHQGVGDWNAILGGRCN